MGYFDEGDVSNRASGLKHGIRLLTPGRMKVDGIGSGDYNL